MASTRDIRNRIRSVSGTKQIVKAMNLVAASKLQKSKVTLMSTRPFIQETRQTANSVIEDCEKTPHPFTKKRDIKNTLVILITGDKGLCGGYNANVSKEAHKLLNGETGEALIVVGNKGRDFFTRRRKTVLETYTGISETPYYEDAIAISNQALNLFKSGEYDAVHLVYTEFKTTLTHITKAVQLLPAVASKAPPEEVNDNTEKKFHARMNYEPGEYEVLNVVLTKYIYAMIFGALVESAACQLASRMTSMDSAADNATKMISSLTLKYNRARQSSITQEITEIVGGAAALE